MRKRSLALASSLFLSRFNVCVCSSYPWEAAASAPLQWDTPHGDRPIGNNNAATYRRPIHYNFPRNENEMVKAEEESGEETVPAYASARSDIVAQYRASFLSSVLMYSTSSAFGALVGQTTIGMPRSVAAMFFLISTLGRGQISDWVRTVSVALLLTLRRSHKVRKAYPTWPHIKACFGAAFREPYPPTRELWKYKPRDKNDPDFDMLWSTAALALVSGACGAYCTPIMSWLGGWLAAGGAVALMMRDGAAGDVARASGMRLVATVGVGRSVVADLKLVPQTGMMLSNILDRLMIFDRQHRVKDRVVSLVTAAAQQVSRISKQRQERSSVEDDQGEKRPNSSRDDRRRRDAPPDRKRQQRPPPQRPQQRYAEGEQPWWSDAKPPDRGYVEEYGQDVDSSWPPPPPRPSNW